MDRQKIIKNNRAGRLNPVERKDGMTKSEILFKIGDACPNLADEVFALLKRLDKSGNFPGPAKEANEKRFAKLCRDALETGGFTGEIWSTLKEIELTLAGPGRPLMTPEIKRKARSIKLSDEEWQEIQRRAAENSVSAAEYIRIKTLAGD